MWKGVEKRGKAHNVWSFWEKNLLTLCVSSNQCKLMSKETIINVNNNYKAKQRNNVILYGVKCRIAK